MDLLILLCFLFIQNVGEVLALNGGTEDGIVDDADVDAGAGFGVGAGVGVGRKSLLTLSPSDPLQSHFVNESLMISCQTIQKDIDARWRDPNGQMRENTKGRVHIKKQSDFILALVFEHLSLSDKGNWTCEVAESGAARKSFELLVNQKISFGKTELVQSVREGRDATVHCFVTGEPPPDVMWFYYGESINTVNSTKHKRLSDGLFIKNVSQADAGEYTCRAIRVTSVFADSDQITILLRIQHKPHWFYNETTPMQYAYIGGAVNLSCDAMGEPPPNFTWLHNGKAIIGRNHRVFYADYGSTLQLQIKNETQFGDYKCKVTNPLGMLERIIKLRSGPKPHSPTVFQLKRWYANAFELDIRTPNIQNAPDDMQIYGYRVEYMSESDFKYSAGNWSYAKRRDFTFDRGYRFVISELATNTSYLMRAASRNLAGLSDWCHVKTFETLSNHASQIFENLSQTQLIFSLVVVLRFAFIYY